MTSVSLLTTLLNDYKSSLAATQPANSNSSIASMLDDFSVTEDSAYSLDLSQAAQDILNNGKAPEEVGAINLNNAQKERLNDILAKYKDAPENEDTLSSLYNDLKQAGLDPDQLAATHEALNFNIENVFLKLISSSDDGSKDVPAIENTLSGLGAPASGTPLGDLFDVQA
jgi:hypothetical protein